MLLARLAGAAVEHGVDAAGILFLGGEGFGFGGGSHVATGFLFDVDGGHKFASFQCSVFREEEAFTGRLRRCRRLAWRRWSRRFSPLQ